MVKPGLVVKNGQGVGVAVAAAAETIVATLNGISTDNAGATISLDGTLDITAGLGTTAVTIQIRRGATVAGPVVGVAEVPALAANARGTFAIQAIDNPGEVAGQAYVLTVTQTAGTGAGTANSAVLTATY